MIALRTGACVQKICALIAMSLVLAGGTESGQIKAGPGQRLPIKIMDAIAVIRDASSLNDVMQALKTARFSAQEMQQLGDEVKRLGLDTKLEKLRRSAEAAKSRVPPVKTVQPDQLLTQKRAALNLQHSKAVQRLNERALSGRPKGDPVVRARTDMVRPIKPALVLSQRQVDDLKLGANARASGPVGSGLSVTFTSVGNGVVGQEMTVDGRGFGSEQGRVAVIVSRQLFYCPVSDWMNTRVTFLLPRELQRYVGYSPGGKEAILWFKAPGRETGPTQTIMIFPDPEEISPVIDSIVPAEIRPGQTVLISGRNFIVHNISRRPTVQFTFPDRTSVSGAIQSSGADFIQVKLPEDLRGHLRSQILVRVTNTVDRTANSNLAFVPAEEIIHIKSREYTAQSQPRGGPLFFISVFGETHRHHLHDWELKNGWVVDDSYLEVWSTGISSGAFYELEPRSGSTLAKATITVWADAYSTAKCWDHLYIRGPRGVPYD